MTAQTKLQKGFTLIELLVVIGILAILLAITLIAINPARQFGQANDTNRRSSVTQILNAIGQYTASNQGILPAPVLSLATTPGVNTAAAFDSDDAGTPGALHALCALLVPDYLPALPVDPSLGDSDGIEEADCAGNWDTGYDITIDSTNRITVSARAANVYEGPIQVTR